MKVGRQAWVIGTAVLLSACIGVSIDAAAAGDPGKGTAAPGGLYVGYYQEDPVTNPEDPVPGAFSLNLPSGDGTFSGSMFFTYVGCQSSNVGTVSGTRTDRTLSGNWSGTVDGLAQSGTYSGTYDATTLAYSGTYLNSKGKQFRDLKPCIEYVIAPKGTFEMFAVEARTPAGFGVAVTARNVTWASPAGGAMTLVYVLDPAVASTSGNPVLWQTIVGPVSKASLPSSVKLVAGRQYVAVVTVLDGRARRIAFGSVRFTTP